MVYALHELLDCHAVINNAFRRGKNVDSINDIANCNDTNHCINDPVIYEEFTKPIVNFVNGWEQKQIQTKAKFFTWSEKMSKCFIFWIHGMNFQNNVDCVFGYGKGKTSNRFTMEEWRVACLLETMAIGFNYKCAIGKAGGKYSARSRDNMTQLFRIDQWDTVFVESVQIEFSSTMRANENDAIDVALNLSQVIPLAVKAEEYIPQLNHIEI
jgi:hypothetical protein